MVSVMSQPSTIVVAVVFNCRFVLRMAAPHVKPSPARMNLNNRVCHRDDVCCGNCEHEMEARTLRCGVEISEKPIYSNSLSVNE